MKYLQEICIKYKCPYYNNSNNICNIIDWIGGIKLKPKIWILEDLYNYNNRINQKLTDKCSYYIKEKIKFKLMNNL